MLAELICPTNRAFMAFLNEITHIEFLIIRAFMAVIY